MKRYLPLIFILSFPLTKKATAQKKNLDFFLSEALKNAPTLSAIENQGKSLALDSLKLKAVYGPQVTANSTLLYAPILKGWGYDEVITNGQNITGGIAVRKQIIGKNNLQTKLSSFSIQKEQLSNQASLLKKTLEQEITQAYLTSYGSQQAYYLARETDSFLQTEDSLLLQLTRNAVYKQTDYLTFKVALQQQDLAARQLKAEFLNNLDNLNYLCGRNDSAWTELERPEIQDSVPGTLLPFEKTLYYQGSLLDSLKNENDAQLTCLNYKPQIQVFADGGYQSSLLYQSYKNWGTSIGLTMTLPIYDGKQKRYALLQNSLQEVTRHKYTDFKRQAYDQKLRQLTGQLNEYTQLISLAKKQLLYARTLVEANRKQLTTGDVRIADYLLSVNNYLNLRSVMIQNDLSRLSLLYQIHNIILQ